MRTLSTVLISLSSDKAEVEEELERLMNYSDIETKVKIKLIKKNLEKLVNLDLVIEKWRQTIDKQTRENNEE